ncbi:hypothetical protein PBRA_008673 [Plasmodiophora brassicae]|uniref:Brix domain-containing protein n=1 Tax=Plasmodiophora brassicae TaxID=37360 RepID=A0A0G4J3A8_PLABS|nr:hypothetical protein PBRA_008673 [Plasmodiophora brassicae]
MYKRKMAMGAGPDDSAAAAKKSKVGVGEDERQALGRAPRTAYNNKQRTLVFSTQGIRHRDRHLMGDLRDLLPHSKKDSKYDDKGNLAGVNEVCDMKNCNSCLFFEARRSTDLYLWVSKTPHGPSAKFLVQNIHTMEELKLTGNCLKGSRPVLSFDASFDAQPHLALLKQMFVQVFGSPRGHPNTKPFVDHVFAFYHLDGRIWFRNYQVVYAGKGAATTAPDPTLVEIGPRFCLQPIKIFAGSFQGDTLYANPAWRASFADLTGDLDTVFHDELLSE